MLTACLPILFLGLPLDHDPATVDRLIRELGHDRFARRESAARALQSGGRETLIRLRNATARERDLEVRHRAINLAHALEFQLNQRDIKAVDGRWRLHSWKHDGREAPEFSPARIIGIANDRMKGLPLHDRRNFPWEFLSNWGKADAAIKLDATAEPRTIEFVTANQSFSGIYTVTDVTLTICYSPVICNCPIRPRFFAADTGNRSLIVLKRR